MAIQATVALIKQAEIHAHIQKIDLVVINENEGQCLLDVLGIAKWTEVFVLPCHPTNGLSFGETKYFCCHFE